MKALEMEDEEVERFLDQADGSTSTFNGSSSTNRRKTSEASTTTVWHSNLSKVLAALLVIAIIVCLTLFQAEKEVVTSTPTSEENPDASTTHHHPPPSSPDTSPLPPPTTIPASPPTPKTAVPTSIPTQPLFEGTTTTTTSTDSSSKSLLYSQVSKFTRDYESSPRSSEQITAWVDVWGKWKFWDGDEESRPTGDYCGRYPHRDIPGDELPDMAWQSDAVFVNHLIDAAQNLIARTKEAIFTEYGHGKPIPPEQLLERQKGFKWEIVDLITQHTPPDKYTKDTGTRGTGGWTSKRAQQGLIRRLLHAIMTNDEFVIVLAGGDNAAGYGGHFHQSYSMQMHRVLEPILARLGVKLITRNMSVGPGFGTVQSSLGFQDLYGDDIDLVIWDATHAEIERDHSHENLDLFIRQALLSGKTKIPQIWVGVNDAFNVLRFWHEQADVDLGEFGTGMDGIQETESSEQAEKLPITVQYLKCADNAQDVCRNHPRFCTQCWIDRPDVDPTTIFDHLSTPPPVATDTSEKPAEPIRIEGQDIDHMGWQEHLLTSRVLLMEIVNALQTAIQIFGEGTMGGPPLEDSVWHVKSYYENIRRKVKKADPKFTPCSNLKERNLPPAVCTTPMHGRTLHTPRYKPDESSLLTVLRAAPDGYKPSNPSKMGYDGPDVHNTCYDIPDGGIDVIGIVSGRRNLEPLGNHSVGDQNRATKTLAHDSSTRSLDESKEPENEIIPGKGWEIRWEKPGTCDGEYRSFCGRERTDPCPLLGYHDSPGMLVGNALSGWLVFDLPDVKEGIIIVSLVTGLQPSDHQRTEGSMTDNNERRLTETSRRRLRNSTLTIGMESEGSRGLGDEDIPDDMIIEWAINGQKSLRDKGVFLRWISRPHRNVMMMVLSQDASHLAPGPTEVAIRLKGCEDRCTFGVSHIYWA